MSCAGASVGFFTIGGSSPSVEEVLRGVTKTVGSGKDFATIQEAIDFFDSKYCVDCIIDVDAGTYSENLDFSNIHGSLTIAGDDAREIIGTTFPHNFPDNYQNITDAGSGTYTLSTSVNDITVTATTTNPDFSDLVSGDKVRTVGASVIELTVSSVSTNTITFTSAPQALASDGSYISILPDRILASTATTSIKANQDIKFHGFLFDSTTDFGSSAGFFDCIGGIVRFEACVFESINSVGVSLEQNGHLEIDEAVSIHVEASARRAIYINKGATCDSNGLFVFGENRIFFCFLSSSAIFTFTNCIGGNDNAIIECDTSDFCLTLSYLRGCKIECLKKSFFQFDASTLQDPQPGGSSTAILVSENSFFEAANSTIDGSNGDGIQTSYNSSTNLQGSTFTNNTGVAVFAEKKGFNKALGLTVSGNGTDFSPGTTLVLGNNDAYNEF